MDKWLQVVLGDGGLSSKASRLRTMQNSVVSSCGTLRQSTMWCLVEARMASGVQAAGAGAHSMDVTVTTTVCLT